MYVIVLRPRGLFKNFDNTVMFYVALVALADALAGEVIFFIKVHVFFSLISAIPSIKS